MDGQFIVLIVIIVVLFLWLAYSAIKIVAEYERLVVFRLGRVMSNPRGPGLIWLWPIIDRPVRVDFREQFLEIPQQNCITKDNAPILIDFLIYWKVTEATDSVVQVANFAGASQGIATTTLRAVIGDISLDDVLAKREQINTVLRTKLDDVTSRWGVKVTTVEIREIVPPREVQDAMNRQMSAERNRRAMVTEAGGQKQSAILVAEGAKQSEILKAEGDRQASDPPCRGGETSTIAARRGLRHCHRPCIPDCADSGFEYDAHSVPANAAEYGRESIHQVDIPHGIGDIGRRPERYR